MNARVRHTVCKPGAAVRIHGYAPARVVRLEYERMGPDYSRGRWWAHCIITARGKIGPHGYRPGERVTVPASDAIPRDIIRISRQSPGRLVWPAFTIEEGTK